MNLVWFEVEGYKRFHDKSKINFDGKLVAIVGPNEAGKTSLLHCLRHLSDSSEFVQKGSMQELTRGKEMSETDVVAEWTFALDTSDYEELSDIQGAACVRWYVITKNASGGYIHSIKPRPDRDLNNRDVTHKEIAAYIENSESEGSEDVKDERNNARLELCKEVLEFLSSDDESLPELALDAFVRLGGSLVDEDLDDNERELAERLSSLHDSESLPPPADQILNRLWDAKPQILLFSDTDRNLLSEYGIREYFYEDAQRGVRKSEIPTALQNLCAASTLDLQAVYDAQVNDDRGKVRTLLEDAEGVINGLLREAWTQSRLTLSLELDAFRLQILLKSQGGDYVKVIERSEGLRQFLSLLLFLSKPSLSEARAIVLIDEAELHLHYDAQADLVQTLAKQRITSKIIYTTHSAGCLPEDLGSGVRMVAAENQYSVVENWFWHSDRPGFSPLLFAMGASTLSFVPMRYSVIGEGAADMILIPAILKQVLQLDSLGFQVVPGLSSYTNEQIGVIDNQSTRTIYLVDGDSAGRAIKGKITDAGIDSSRIVDLPNLSGQDTVLEDYISAELYVRCVNVDLSMSGCPPITEAMLSGPNRPQKIESWCQKHNKSPPSKRSVAYRVVDEKHQHKIVDESAVEAVKALYSKIRTALQIKNE